MNKDKDWVEPAPFNMAALFYYRFQEIDETKIQAMLKNDFDLALDCLNLLQSKISFKLTNEEYDELDNIIKQITPKVTLWKRAETSDSRELMMRKIKNKMKEADRKLLRFMHKYNMIFPKLDIKRGLIDLEEKYNLK